MRRSWWSLFLIVGLLLAGCTGNGSTPNPRPNADTPERAAAELAAGLAKKDLKAVEFTGASGADVDALFQPLVAGMGPLKPEVSVGSVTREVPGLAVETVEQAVLAAYAETEPLQPSELDASTLELARELAADHRP